MSKNRIAYIYIGLGLSHLLPNITVPEFDISNTHVYENITEEKENGPETPQTGI